jgi:alpha-D-ribose 1-methylphosphonate 5-triphosphate synthase subunit PhnL
MHLQAGLRLPVVAGVDFSVEAGQCVVLAGPSGALLQRLAIPQRLWQVSPVTFSGGEQQRVNIARGFLPERPILLLDEPTASLDAVNRATVIELIAVKKRRGVAIVAIVHDDEVRGPSPTAWSTSLNFHRRFCRSHRQPEPCRPTASRSLFPMPAWCWPTA